MKTLTETQAIEARRRLDRLEGYGPNGRSEAGYASERYAHEIERTFGMDIPTLRTAIRTTLGRDHPIMRYHEEKQRIRYYLSLINIAADHARRGNIGGESNLLRDLIQRGTELGRWPKRRASHLRDDYDMPEYDEDGPPGG